MSVHVSSRVWRLKLNDHAEKVILLKLADCADDDGSNAWPSVATIAAECNMSERTVQRALRDMEGRGVITVQRAALRGAKKPTVYRIHTDRAPVITRQGTGDKMTPHPPERGDIHDASEVTSTTETGVRMAPDPSVDPSKDPLPLTRVRAKELYVRYFGGEREPSDAIIEELINWSVFHPQSCIDDALKWTVGSARPTWNTARMKLNDCLQQPHRPRKESHDTANGRAAPARGLSAGRGPMRARETDWD